MKTSIASKQSSLSISIKASIAAAALLAVSSPAHAYSIYFGQDINNQGGSTRIPYANAQAAENSFRSNLMGVGTETFESFQAGTTTPLNLTFPGSTGSITATLSGGNGRIVSVPTGTNGTGRYPISGDKFWEVSAGGGGNFEVNFSQQVAAFGFYGVDIGDFGGQIQLQLTNGTTTTVTVPNTIGSNGSTDGSVLFYGLMASNAAETFTKVSFLTTTGQGDVFAFDNLIVGDFKQMNKTPEPVNKTPEPASVLGLLAIGALGAGAAWKRKLK
jgi:hypothetical protein